MALKAGSARVDITPKTQQQLVGYGPRQPRHESIHRPLYARAVYFRSGDGDALLANVEMVHIDESSVQRVQAALHAELGLPPERVWISATHTHAAPAFTGDQADPEWLGMVEQQVVAAAALARTRLVDAQLSFARSQCDIGCNRREQRPDGEVVLGRNPNGFVDREVLVLGVNAPGGAPVARIVNFGCHPTILGWLNTSLSSEWPGAAAATAEAELQGGVFLFINGGAGNINPIQRGGIEVVERLAAQFCASYREACARFAPLDNDGALAGRALTVRLPRKLRDAEDGKGKTGALPIFGMRIGPVRLVGFPGEIFSETSAAVKQTSPHQTTLIGSKVGGYRGGYIPTAESFDTGGYEVRMSHFNESAESILRQGFLRLLAEL